MRTTKSYFQERSMEAQTKIIMRAGQLFTLFSIFGPHGDLLKWNCKVYVSPSALPMPFSAPQAYKVYILFLNW